MALQTPLESPIPAPIWSVGQVAETYHGALLTYLRRRVRGSAEPADVAQEAYMRLMQYEGSEHVRSPYAMLLRIALNVARDMHRSDQVRRHSFHQPIDGLELIGGAGTPESHALSAEALDRALDAIDRLPARRREVFLLHRRHHLSYAEIATRCGISIKMVEKHISSALAFCLSEVWGDEAG